MSRKKPASKKVPKKVATRKVKQNPKPKPRALDRSGYAEPDRSHGSI